MLLMILILSTMSIDARGLPIFSQNLVNCINYAYDALESRFSNREGQNRKPTNLRCSWRQSTELTLPVDAKLLSALAVLVCSSLSLSDTYLCKYAASLDE